jgi:molybdopterin molybdotransferase
VTVAPATENLLPVADALERLLARLTVTAVESVPLRDACGRVLAEDVVSNRLLPGCDNSVMDGFAVRSSDCAGAAADAPVTLRIQGDSRAGAPAGDHAPGTATPITTDAPLPRGADAVVRVEDTRMRDARVDIHAAVTRGTDVRRAGGDVRPGMVIVPAGRRLRPVDIAACAAVGAVLLPVRRRPRIAVVGGGDELVAPEVEPAAHQVADSNSAMLATAVAEAGGDPMPFGVMGDERAEVRRRLLAAAECDLIVSSAGVSVGQHDHVGAVVEELGTVDVRRIAMRPGKPLLVGSVRGTPLLGLPGNPVSSAVTFELFGRPAILAMQGASRIERRRIAVRLGKAVSTPRALETYLRVQLEDASDGIPVARLSGDQGSSMTRSLSDADALLVVPVGVGVGDVAAGTPLTAIELT